MQINPPWWVCLIWVNVIADQAWSNIPIRSQSSEMPMSAPNLNEQQTASLSQQLRSRYAALRQRSAPPPAEPATGAEVHDMKDDASSEALNEVRAADRQRDAAEMDDIEQALARMHAQTYGVCVDCGQAIGLERLQAYPTAKRCRDCQEAHERGARRSASH